MTKKNRRENQQQTDRWRQALRPLTPYSKTPSLTSVASAIETIQVFNPGVIKDVVRTAMLGGRTDAFTDHCLTKLANASDLPVSALREIEKSLRSEENDLPILVQKGVAAVRTKVGECAVEDSNLFVAISDRESDARELTYLSHGDAETVVGPILAREFEGSSVYQLQPSVVDRLVVVALTVPGDFFSEIGLMGPYFDGDIREDGSWIMHQSRTRYIGPKTSGSDSAAVAENRGTSAESAPMA